MNDAVDKLEASTEDLRKSLIACIRKADRNTLVKLSLLVLEK